MKNLLTLAFLLLATLSYSQIKGLMTTDAQKAEKAAQEEVKAEAEALFAGRSTSPGADVASDKANIPEKKETLTQKFARYKNQGFKVAVVFTSGKIRTKPQNPSSTTAASSLITLSGSLPSMKSDLTPLAEDFTSTMNEAFSTDVFEMVDLSTIPYLESKGRKLDNWGATKYKMVVNYTANPEYEYTLSSGEYEASLTVKLNVYATEYVNEKKGVKMKYPIRAGDLGYYKSSKWTSENEPGFKNIEELKTVVNAPAGTELLSELQKEQESKMDKFIEKSKK